MLSCFSHVWLFMTLWTVGHQAFLSVRFSRQEYWSGLPCPSPGDLPNTGIEPLSLTSPALAGKFFTTSATWEASHPPLYTLKHTCTLIWIYLKWNSSLLRNQKIKKKFFFYKVQTHFTPVQISVGLWSSSQHHQRTRGRLTHDSQVGCLSLREFLASCS